MSAVDTDRYDDDYDDGQEDCYSQRYFNPSSQIFYCTAYRVGNSRYTGPYIAATSYRRARKKARRLGVIVEGQYIESVSMDGEVLSRQQTFVKEAVGIRRACLAYAPKTRFGFARAWFADICRESCRWILILADAVEPCRTRRDVARIDW